MATGSTARDQTWGMLGDAPEGEREAQILRRYTELASLPDIERLARVMPMARAEFDLPDDKLRAFTRSRLRAWLQMDAAAAKKISTSYASAMQQMPGTVAMRAVALSQTMAMEFHLNEQDKLRVIEPNVFGPLRTAEAADTRASPTPGREAAPAKKGGLWPFGKKR